jgi:cytochrome P450
VPVWRRVTTRPVTIGGVGLPEGAKLFLWLAAGGRDAAVFPDPDRFDLDRANSAQPSQAGPNQASRGSSRISAVSTPPTSIKR